MRISVGDIQSITGYGANQNPFGCISYQIGSAKSGEIFNESATVFRSPGIISLPMTTGTFNPDGSFTASQYSTTCSQAIVVENNFNWFVLGTRDTRNQMLLPATNNGETRIFPEGNPQTNTYYDINGNILTTVGSNSNASITNIAPKINLQNDSSSPTKHVAIGETVDSNFTTILSAVSSLLTALPATSNPYTLALVTALEDFCNAITNFPTTASTFVNITE